MNTHSADILSRLASGQISADEAARLLREPARPDALLSSPPSAPAPGGSVGYPTEGRWLHIRVTNLDNGKPKVSVNVPLSWIPIGMKIGAKYQPELAAIDFNEVVALLQAGTDGKLIEVEDLDDGERVEIYVD